MTTPMDIFDLMLERIQQFPLDANLFERNIKRLNKDHQQCKEVFEKYLAKLIYKNNPKVKKKFKELSKKMKEIIISKREITKNYESKVDNLLNLLNSMVDKCETKFSIKALEGNKPAIINIKSPVETQNKYCSCRQAPYDKMIWCNNPKCKIKWYHFGCVNLTSSPKETWTCPNCTLELLKVAI